MKREANFTLLFRHWLKANPLRSSAFELKQTRTDSINFNAVKEHQLIALQAAKGDHGLLYKIPDDAMGVKPCDMMYLRCSGAFVVIKYPRSFVLIDVDEFIIERDISIRKSLTEKRAKEIASYTVEL